MKLNAINFVRITHVYNHDSAILFYTSNYNFRFFFSLLSENDGDCIFNLIKKVFSSSKKIFTKNN